MTDRICSVCNHLKAYPGGYSECAKYGCQLCDRQPCEQCLREGGCDRWDVVRDG